MRRAVPLLLVCAAPLAGCAQAPEDRVLENVQHRLDGIHGGYLERRALDPYSTGAEAIADLDPYGYALSSSAEGGTTTFLHAVGSVVETGGGLSYDQTSAGACVRVTVRAGDGGDDRGSVTTEPVRCPAGTLFDTEKGVLDVAVETTDLEARSDDVGVPAPDRSVCLSGGAPCTEGGG